jgi:MYXO-CTERM domain-containing protein
VYPDLHCEADSPCPPDQNDVAICYQDAVVGRCWGGGLAGVETDCAIQDGWCSTAQDTAPHCVSRRCVAGPADVPVAHDVCTLDGQLAHCTDAGDLVTPVPCSDGEVCQADGSSARCVPVAVADAGPPSPDGAALDAQPASDASGEGSPSLGGGCDCRTGAGDAPLSLLPLWLLVGLLFARRRR